MTLQPEVVAPMHSRLRIIVATLLVAAAAAAVVAHRVSSIEREHAAQRAIDEAERAAADALAALQRNDTADRPWHDCDLPAEQKLGELRRERDEMERRIRALREQQTIISTDRERPLHVTQP